MGKVDYIKLGLLLCVVCVISSFALSVTYSITKERIDMQNQKDIQDSLPIVAQGASSFSDKKIVGDIDYYEAKDANKKNIGYALYGSVQGYQSVIKFMVGIDLEGNISGLKILEHGETPGLGARITEVKSDETLASYINGVFEGKEGSKKSAEPWFTQMFKSKFYKNLYVSKSDSDNSAIHAITGATITTVCVVDGVKEVVGKFLKHINGK